MTEEERRREEARLNALSVKARIIVGPPVPNVISRTGFENGIDFQVSLLFPFTSDSPREILQEL